MWEGNSFSSAEIESRPLNIISRNSCFCSVMIALPSLLIMEYTKTRTLRRKILKLGNERFIFNLKKYCISLKALATIRIGKCIQ
jgi:hypothetical protein